MLHYDDFICQLIVLSVKCLVSKLVVWG